MVFLGISRNPLKEDVKQWWGKETALSEADCEKTVVKRILYSKKRTNFQKEEKTINGTSRPATRKTKKEHKDTRKNEKKERQKEKRMKESKQE